MLEKMQPFDLNEVPSGLEWCVYDEERQRGSVMCNRTAYLVVLTLRWMLSYTESGLDEEYETYKVYWESNDEYGFHTRIYLSREKVEQYDAWEDEMRVLQEPLWFELAILHCGNGRGVIDKVIMQLGQPYGRRVHLRGETGVRRLFEDATHASVATDDFYPIQHTPDGDVKVVRRIVERLELSYRLVLDYSRVTDIDLKVVRVPDRY